MEVTFELTQEMIENELLSVYYNTSAFNSFGSYMKSPLGTSFMKHLNCDYEMKDYWAEKINPLKTYSIDIFETPFGKYALANYADQKNVSDGGVGLLYLLSCYFMGCTFLHLKSEVRNDVSRRKP